MSSDVEINQKLDEILAEARAIKLTLKLGGTTYEKAKDKIKPLLIRVNAIGKEIAKKYKRKYREIKFINL